MARHLLSGHRIGFAVRSLDDAARGYMAACGTRRHIEACQTDWRVFEAWVMGPYWKPALVIVVTTNCAVPYLPQVRRKMRPRIIAIELGEPLDGFDFDDYYTAKDLGWGVDKRKFKSVAENRPLRQRPVFYLTEPAPHLEAEIQKCGYECVTAPLSYGLGDVAIVPSPRLVPVDIFEAAASGLMVVSVEGNAHWLEQVCGCEVCLEEGVEALIDHIMGLDYRFAGLMAMDMVPDFGAFRKRVRNLVWALDMGCKVSYNIIEELTGGANDKHIGNGRA